LAGPSGASAARSRSLARPESASVSSSRAPKGVDVAAHQRLGPGVVARGENAIGFTGRPQSLPLRSASSFLA
jgi:hypothetical protein